jgi:hypothetical protein
MAPVFFGGWTALSGIDAAKAPKAMKGGASSEENSREC